MNINEFINNLLGPTGVPPGMEQMCLRAIIIFFITLFYVRVAGLRLLSRYTPIDFVFSIIFCDVMSKAITGSTAFLPTVVTGAVLLTLHYLLNWLAYRSHTFGNIVKGHPIIVIKDGAYVLKNMRRTNTSTHDIKEALRIKAHMDDIGAIREAYLERDGQISVILFDKD